MRGSLWGLEKADHLLRLNFYTRRVVCVAPQYEIPLSPLSTETLSLKLPSLRGGARFACFAFLWLRLR